MSDPRTTQHDVTNCALVVAGVPATGLAKGADAVTFARNANELVTIKMGSNGDVQVSANKDRSGKITGKFLKGDPFNRHLFELLRIQEEQGLNPFTVSMVDGNVGFECFSEYSYIMKFPEVQQGDEGQDAWEWEILVTHARLKMPRDLTRLILPAT